MLGGGWVGVGGMRERLCSGSGGRTDGDISYWVRWMDVRCLSGDKRQLKALCCLESYKSEWDYILIV